VERTRWGAVARASAAAPEAGDLGGGAPASLEAEEVEKRSSSDRRGRPPAPSRDPASRTAARTRPVAATATRREGEAPVESRRRAALPRPPVGERRGSFSRGVVGVERGGRERWCGRMDGERGKSKRKNDKWAP